MEPSTVPLSPLDYDRRLVEGILAGDESAVCRVRSWIRRSSGKYRRLLANEAEDLEQEILIALIDRLAAGSFSFESRLETYVSRMVHYKCIDRMRALNDRKWVDLSDLQLVDSERSALEELEGQETSLLAVRVAASLSTACRKLWEMIHDGLDYKTMAERTGVAPGTLRVRVLRCRRMAIVERNRLGGNSPHQDAEPRQKLTRSPEGQGA